ncbi:MAG: TRAP transporter permease [Candidatus Rokubacteria bacterium]|nr:TRAP transporter permease [Candidatus Rokubacteria bacterium]
MALAETAPAPRQAPVGRPRNWPADVGYYLVAFFLFIYLVNYYLSGVGGPTLLAITLVPVTFILFTLDELRRNELYPRLGTALNWVVAAVYVALALAVAVYTTVEYEMIGTVRAGIFSRTDLLIGGLMLLLIMEYARKKYMPLFVLNVILILFTAYGWLVPGMFSHPGLSWTRIVSAMSMEMATGVFSRLPQLALTLIGSFILVLSALRAFGCVDSILRLASSIAARSPHAVPQSAVLGSFGVAAVSGSGAANAATTGSATIPAMIAAGLPRVSAAAVETASSLGGQLMPPIMGISAFLMADFLGRSYFDVVARGYAPALIYFAGVSLGVYLLSVRHRSVMSAVTFATPGPLDRLNLVAYAAVVGGLVVLMGALGLPPMIAALRVFVVIGLALLAVYVVVTWRAGALTPRALAAPVLRLVDNFAGMTADLTLLLATLSIMTGAFVITGVPTKVGFLLIQAAGVNLVAMIVVAFVFGAIIGTGLPPAPTYIVTALVIVPPMTRVGVDPWVVHFFAFFLAVWGELTPPTSVVAAVAARIADASFMGTLLRALPLCASLFVLMGGIFARPELVLEPGLPQLGAAGLILAGTVGITFSLQARYSERRVRDLAARSVLAAVALVIVFHPRMEVVGAALGVLAVFLGYWLVQNRRHVIAAREVEAG